MLNYITITIIGFISGSVMYSYILPKLLKKVDIREISEDGNPGSMNAITESGPIIGLVCLMLDLLKAAVPVYIAVAYLHILGHQLVPIMIAPVLGHAFSPFLNFRGGKAVAPAFGVLLGALGISGALIALMATMAFLNFVIVIEPNSAKVITAFLLASIFVWLFEPIVSIKIAMIIISLVVCGKHLVNPNKGGVRIFVAKQEVLFRRS